MAGKVTAIEPQKRNRKRANVFIDGQYALGVAATVAATLEIGQWLEDSEIERLDAADEQEVAYQRALHFLSYRPLSTQEIRQKLQGKGFSEFAVDTTVQRLEETGLIDDLEFARYWVEQREQFRPRGIAMLRYELRQKGLAADLIALSLQGIDEDELAYRAAHRRAEQLSMLPPKDFERKLGAYLARRGFPYPVVRETVNRLREELCPALDE
jgi:regulatory protein